MKGGCCFATDRLPPGVTDIRHELTRGPSLLDDLISYRKSRRQQPHYHPYTSMHCRPSLALSPHIPSSSRAIHLSLTPLPPTSPATSSSLLLPRLHPISETTQLEQELNHLINHGLPTKDSPQGRAILYSSPTPTTTSLTPTQVIILGDSGVGKTSLMNQYVRLPLLHPP